MGKYALLCYKCKFFLILLFCTAFLSAQDSTLLNDLRNGPSLYYSSDAYSYFNLKNMSIPPQVDRETAFKCFSAAMNCASMGKKAAFAIPTILDKFHTAYHVTETRNAQYSGEGTFDDWVQTYLTSEKNKFLLASPFMDYPSMSLCDRSIKMDHETEFIEKSVGRGGVITRARVNLTITFTLYLGACVLEQITGESFGNDLQAWKNWWEQNGTAFLSESTAASATYSKGNLSNGQTLNEILIKGKYRVGLFTGDELVGMIEAKDDSSVILETTDGKPYSIHKNLIKEFELLERPKTKLQNTPGVPKRVSFDELYQSEPQNVLIEVRISNGSAFKGKLVFIDQSTLKIDVDGSVIPMAKEVITELITNIELPKTPVNSTTEKNNTPPGPLDTVVVKNGQNDEWGKPLPDQLFCGTITAEDNQSITLKTAGDSIQRILRTGIQRIIRHTSTGFDEPIKKYAKPLFCPEDMFIVDLPPGKQGRPFFKVCVDRYEYPNKKDAVPQGNVSFEQAEKLCNQVGKRLCTVEEWQWGCSGMEGYTYPYGWNKMDEKCNTDGTRPPERSGSRLNCVSKFGGYDMVGNIFEWVKDSNNKPQAMGGPYSKCQTVASGESGSAKPTTGFRCCKSN